MKNEMTIEQFCIKHNACRKGRKWALSLGISTMRELWQRDDIKPEWRIWIASRPGVMSKKDLWQFTGLVLAIQAWHLLTNKRNRNAVMVTEKYANGEATKEELENAAKDAADVATGGAAEVAMMSTAWAAAFAAADVADVSQTAAKQKQMQKLMEYEVDFSGGEE